ncbi:MAG TPA: hypothetical protein VJP85_11205, partial [Candidatus Baltobacteraceae bacterium]|nr:hypothetical protein [Candidatus Baltobacteraceae bacterium]
MRSLVCAFFAFFFGLLPIQAVATPHVLAQLGTAPLVPPIHSTAEFQADIADRPHLYSTAAAKLGLTPSEYAEFVLRVRAGRVAYVTIPRHLDAMAGAPRGTVEVLSDVIIPANTRGWEIDLPEKHDILAVFIPAKCGNLSVLRRALPVLAHAVAHPKHGRARVVAKKPKPRMTLAAAPSPSPHLPTPAPSPAPTPAPYASVATTSGPVHHFRAWPLLLVPLIAGFVHGGHGAGLNSPIVAGPVGAGIVARPVGGIWGPRTAPPPLPTPAP